MASLKLSETGLVQVEEALRDLGWKKHSPSLVRAAGVSLASLKRYWRRQPIRPEVFVAICQTLRVEPLQVADDVTVHSLQKQTEHPRLKSRLSRNEPEENEIEKSEKPTRVPVELAQRSNFVGREDAISQLKELETQGTKIVLLKGMGGVGKTTLAKNYISQYFELSLELWMARRMENIISANRIVENWLRRLGAKGKGDFLCLLEQLREKLKEVRVGILIDNFETILDSSGYMAEGQLQWQYLELLRVLSDSTVQSFTLITSRIPLNEPAIDYHPYPLTDLSNNAWQQFFQTKKIDLGEPSILRDVWKAYGGNTKAMTIIAGSVLGNFNGKLTDYWQINQPLIQQGLIEPSLERIVGEQFDYLKCSNQTAYNLLCCLGAYRYQEIPKISGEGLSCLFSGNNEIVQQRVIRELRDRNLIEFSVESSEANYWLHPIIWSEASGRLRENLSNWQRTHEKVAAMWERSVTQIRDTKDVYQAFEAFYHYQVIEDYDKASAVIIMERPIREKTNSLRHYSESLGSSFCRLSLITNIRSCIQQIEGYLKNKYYQAKILDILGYTSSLLGEIDEAIENHTRAGFIVSQILEEHNENQLADEDILIHLKIDSKFNIGLCEQDRWNHEEALKHFEEAIKDTERSELSRADKDKQITSIQLSQVYSLSCLKKEESKHDVMIVLEKAGKVDFSDSFWAEGNYFLRTGLSLANVGEFQQALEQYEKLDFYVTEHLDYPQVKARASTGVAAVYRAYGQFDIALSKHKESIVNLQRINSVCDLAEAYFQTALTYQVIGDTAQAQAYFNDSLKLFRRMNAPKQVERIKECLK